MQQYFADMHIHIGRDMFGKPVKITASKTLTITNILKESSRNKGIHMVGVIDCQSPGVQAELKNLIAEREARELEDGGIQFENVTLLLGSEIEVYDENCKGPIHVLCYLPTLSHMEKFSEWLVTRMKNMSLSSQRYYGSAKELQYKVKELEGIFIPAHVFTPYKSLFGKGVQQSLTEVLDADLVDAIELGLSSDTQMADQIHELHDYTFVTNSDAHSLGKIAREYQEVIMEKPSFKEFQWAIHSIHGRKIERNFGMNPRLGKYHTTVCDQCLEELEPTVTRCSQCGSKKVVKGVADRIKELSNSSVNKEKRPPYLYQVPLEYIPKLGPKTYQILLENFQTEMNIIHSVPYEELRKVVSEQIAQSIIALRNGKLTIKAGGGGKYGSITSLD